MPSIFSPRVAYEKKDGKLVKVDYISPGQGHWDQYYYDVEEVEYLVPGESGDPEDFIKKFKIKVTKRSIADTINSQADDVGLENSLRKFALTGDPSVLPSPVNASDEVFDLTGLPQDSAEYFEYVHGLAAAFEQLPLDLRKDMTMEVFTQKVIKGEIDVHEYLESLKPKEKKEGDGNV